MVCGVYYQFSSAKHSATTESVPEFVIFFEDSFSDQEKQFLHSFHNMGQDRAIRSLEKQRERRDLLACLEKGFLNSFQRFLVTAFVMFLSGTEHRRLRL